MCERTQKPVSLEKITRRVSAEDSMSLHSQDPGKGSAALAPIITQQMTTHHTALLHYSKGEENECSFITSATFSFRSDK